MATERTSNALSAAIDAVSGSLTVRVVAAPETSAATASGPMRVAPKVQA